MKKLSVFVLLMFLLVVPSQSLASDETIHNLNFNDIETLILKNNPIVLVNENLRDITEYKFEDAEDSLENAKTNTLQTQMTSLQNDLTQVVNSLSIYTIKRDELQAQKDASIALGGDLNAKDQSLLDSYSALAAALTIEKAALETQIQVIDNQLLSSEKEDDLAEDKVQGLEKSDMSLDMSNDIQIWTAESLFLAYNNLIIQRQMIQKNHGDLERQYYAMKLQHKLGFITETSLNNIYTQLQELENTINNLLEQEYLIVGQLNLMLGQPYDTSLTLGEIPELKEENIIAMNFSKDYDEVKSYTIRLKFNEWKSKNQALERKTSGTYEYLIAEAEVKNIYSQLLDAQRKHKLDFLNAYNKVKSAAKNLSLEENRLEQEKLNSKNLDLKFKLGLISALTQKNQNSTFEIQKLKVREAQDDLYKAYREYEWFKKGLTLSTN